MSEPQTEPKADEKPKKAEPQKKVTLAERRAKAAAYRRRQSHGVVQNADPKLHYSVFFTSDFPAAVCDQMRDALERRGFDPCNGPRFEGAPRAEFVADRATAEIWACPLEIRDDEWRESLLECLRSKTFVVDQERKPETRSVSMTVLNRAKAYHKALRTDGEAAKAEWEALENLVFTTPIIKLGNKPE